MVGFYYAVAQNMGLSATCKRRTSGFLQLNVFFFLEKKGLLYFSYSQIVFF